MITRLIAKCECGYKEDCRAGRNPIEAVFPALCLSCEKVTNIDLLGDQFFCLHCSSDLILFYDEDGYTLFKEGETVAICEAEDIDDIGYIQVLKKGPYICPNCKKFLLCFTKCGDEEFVYVTLSAQWHRFKAFVAT